jgi:poly-beta-1,6-N-acetyl-D-glucosamine synthase
VNALNKKKRILALIPAHNESEFIDRTLMSVINQTYSNTDILVVSDNSTDDTVKIVQELMKTYNSINIIETVNNKFKKSGAINAAYKFLGDKLNNYDYILGIDGDTILADDIIEQALIEFDLNNKLGAVCSRAGVAKRTTKNLLEKFIYHCQYVEYAEFDRSRIGQDKSIKVAHGMCTFFKVEAIKDVMKSREAKGDDKYDVYKVTNITEDFELTVTLKELGYDTSAGFGMYAWTDVPLSISELWKQRVRWLRGGLDTLWDHGWNKVTAKYIFEDFLFWIMLFLQTYLLKYAISDIIGGNYHLSKSVLVIMGIMYIDCVYTMRYVQNPQKWDYFVRLTFIPQLLYAWFAIAQHIYAYYLFMVKKSQEW